MNNYELIASELSMLIYENEKDIESRVYALCEDYIKEYYPTVPKQAYLNIIDHAFRIYVKI